MSLATLTEPAPAPTADLLRRFDVPGPRYTSYPTADRFADTFGEADYRRALARRAASARPAPLSLYVHIPFCEHVCFYCACNKIVTRKRERAAEYLDVLEAEIALQADALGRREAVSQLHLGGGTPTYLDDDQLARLMALLRARFDIVPGAEMSIEVDPRTVDAARLQALSHLGFNRLSFGVQDFDPDVQRAVNRIQSVESVTELVGHARALGFESINVDLIYGLPKQSPASIARTVEQVVALMPDRVALYGYAHLPERFKPQRSIDRQELPTAADRTEMLRRAIDGFAGAGYAYIGMDHFARPNDSLAIAKREGRLHRNFQGYSTQPDCDLIGLGVSSIGRVGDAFAQNAKSLLDYYEAVRAGRLPVLRGIELDADDLVRRDAIMAIMCQGRLAFDDLDAAHAVDSRRYFADEIGEVASLADDGLCTVTDDAIELTPLGWYFVRAVAMTFDRYLRSGSRVGRFSRVL
jgi:oxygen-independent coproporphyrinogen-3 oxidase